jgi:hypothetical protein
LFEIEQVLFAPESAPITTQPAARIHDPMAWNEDDDPIAPIRLADRSHPSRDAHLASDIGIGSRPAEGNRLQCLPDSYLKWRAAQNQGNAKLTKPACKISSQFFLQSIEMCVLAWHQCAAPQTRQCGL